MSTPDDPNSNQKSENKRVFLTLVLLFGISWIIICLYILFGHLETIEGIEGNDSKDEVRVGLIFAVTTTIGVITAALVRVFFPKARDDKEKD